MTTRLVGLGLIAIGVVFAVLFVYFPLRDIGNGAMGPVGTKGLVFIPLAIISGLAFAIGGDPVLRAFQARNKTKGQMTLVLSIIVIAGVATGVSYWQISSRFRAPESVILAPPIMPPPSVIPR